MKVKTMDIFMDIVAPEFPGIFADFIE